MIRVDVTPDTPEWLEERRASVGASEAAALVGASPWTTPLGLYLSKIGKSEPFDETLGYVTHAAEPLIAGWIDEFCDDIGELHPGFMARHGDHPWLHATFDRVTYEYGQMIPVQLKTSSPFKRREWDNGIIPAYQVQEDVECLIADAPYAWVVVWHYMTDFQVFKHYANPSRQREVSAAARDLMGRVGDRRPPLAQLGDDIASLYPASAGKTVTADGDVMDAWERLVEAERVKREVAAEHDADIADARFVIEDFMQDATELIDPFGQLIHTWRPNKNGQRRHWTPKKEKK